MDLLLEAPATVVGEEDQARARRDQQVGILAVNVRGPFLLTLVVLGDMKAARWGRIVNISSSSAQTGAINMIP